MPRTPFDRLRSTCATLRLPAAVFLLYVLFALIATWPLALHLGDHVLGGKGPQPMLMWAMSVVLHQLPSHPLALFEGTAFYPYPHSLAFSEHVIVPALMSAPILWLTGNNVVAYNVVVLLTFATGALGTFLLGRKITGDAWAGFGAGLLYAFHTWNVNEIQGLQIISNQWFPFVLLALLCYFERPSGRRALWVALTYALQSFSCMYWSLYLPFVFGLTVLFLLWRTRATWRALVPLALALAPVLLLLALVALQYSAVARAYGFERPDPGSLPVGHYFRVLPNSWLYEGWLTTAFRNYRAAHFLGFSALALAVVGFVSRRRVSEHATRLTPLFAVFVVTGFLLSLGMNVVVGDEVLAPAPYRLLHAFVPGFRNVRYTERLSLVLMLGLAPLVAIGLARLRPRLGRIGLVLLSGLIFVEHLALPQELLPLAPGSRAPGVYRWIAKQDDVRVTAEVPASPYLATLNDTLPMYFSGLTWKRTVQGLTSYFPPTYPSIKWRLWHFPDSESVAFLERLGVDTLIVTPRNGRLPRWAHEDPRWTVVGPFAEGHLALRLRAAPQPDFPLRPLDTAGYVALDPRLWHVDASEPGAERAVDGQLKTSWATRGAQRQGDFIRVRFRQPQSVARLVLELPFPLVRVFPMRLEVRGRTEEGGWESLPFDEAAAYDQLFARLLHTPRQAQLVLDVPPRRLRAVQLRIREDDFFGMEWSVPELRLYGPQTTADNHAGSDVSPSH